jgi:hypothetical protein
MPLIVLSFLANRRCAIFATLIAAVIFSQKAPSVQLSVATAVIIAGAILTGWYSFETDLFGISFVWVNNFVQAIVNVMIERKNKQKTLSVLENLAYS